MEIQSSTINNKDIDTSSRNKTTQSGSDVKFADELKELEKSGEKTNEKTDEKPVEKPVEEQEEDKTVKATEDKEVSEALDKLKDTVTKLNQPEDKFKGLAKDILKNTDNNKEGNNVINNNFNIENKDKLPQMTPDMSFAGDGQPFSSFMNNEQANQDKTLANSAEDLAEEAAILSTMAENIAMANKMNLKDSSDKTVTNEEGIKKIDTNTSIVKEVIVKYDAIMMNEADVEVFANLVEGNEVNLNHLTAESIHKSVHVSKTLADMLAKAMEDNKPVRIEFDNGISVIIKISRDGKLSADFLPSTQVAEAYLKENLPLLKQRLNEQNLDYDELNQRERRNPDRDQNRKKGRDNE